jgi:hypothetical protein
MLSFAVLREFSELELSGTLQTEAFIAPTGDTQAGALGSSHVRRSGAWCSAVPIIFTTTGVTGEEFQR